MTLEKLKQYRQLQKEATDMKNRIDVLENRIAMSTCNLNNEQIAEWLDEKNFWIMKRKQIKQALFAIEDWIGALDDSRACLIFRLRYIDGLHWWKVAKKVGYEERHVRRIHNKIISHLN